MKRVSNVLMSGLALLLVLVGLAAVQGCKSGETANVVGKWVEVDGPDTVDFNPDGSYAGNFVYDSDAFQKAIAGTYKVDGDKVKLTAKGDPKDSMTWVVTSSNGIMSVVFKDGGAPKLDGSKTKFKPAK